MTLRRNEQRHISVGKGITVLTPCCDNCSAWVIVKATGKGISIDPHPCQKKCKPAVTLRYYLHGDDSVSVELRE